MTCYHPLHGFVIGETANGKRELKICSGDTDYITLNPNGVWIPRINKKLEKVPQSERIDTPTMKEKFLKIPCGQCLGCRIQYSKDWATRMMCELRYADCASFITLTYDDVHVPSNDGIIDFETGEIGKVNTLDKKHFQLFMKRLRKHYPDKKIRFYACGEYGEQSWRPHYHAILFGVDFAEDKYQYSVSLDGFAYYRSPTLEKLWDKGYSMVCDVSWNTCAYVARYVTKKMRGQEAKFYELRNIVPEFSLMSRRPGIGRLYYDDHKKEIYENCELFFQGMKGGIKAKPPRYFNKLYDLEYPDEYKRICEDNVKMSDNISSLKLSRTTLNLPELLEVEERQMEQKAKLLRRDDV